MTAVTAIAWVFALLLAAAGAQKLTDPAATGAALQVAKLPSDARLVRLLGLYEVGVGAAVLLVGGVVPAALLAVTYAAFGGFAGRQSRLGEGCGCFGEADAPTTSLHVGVNTLAAVVATGAAFGAPAAVTLLGTDWLMMAAATTLLVTATALLRLGLTALPDLHAAQARVAAEGDT